MINRTLPSFRFFVLLILTAAAVLPAAPAAAWTDATHERMAAELLPLLPPELQKLCSRENEAYLEGIADQEELFALATEEVKGTPSPAQLHQKGMELLFLQLKRIIFFFDKKSEDKAMAYDIGKTVRLAADMLEPMPDGEEFSPVEIAGNRMFFTDDTEQALEDYRYTYVNRKPIRSFPERIAAELEIAGRNGGIIYKAYREGRGYGVVENEAHVSINRALNFMADTFHTLYYKPFSAEAKPFDPVGTLKLDRFRRDSKNDGAPTVKPPDPPSAPNAPAAPEKQENDEEKNTEKETQSD